MNIKVALCAGLLLTICQHPHLCAADDQAPAAKSDRVLIATIFGRQVFSDDPSAKQLFEEITTKAMQRYARDKKLRPTPEQLKKMIADTIAQHPELSESEEAKRKTAMRMFWLWGSHLDWIVAKSLHEEYGGALAISSFGAYTSIAGRDATIRGYVEAGDIKFHQAEAEREFWERLRSKRVLDVTLTDQQRIERRLAVSPWQRWIQELEYGSGKAPTEN